MFMNVSYWNYLQLGLISKSHNAADCDSYWSSYKGHFNCWFYLQGLEWKNSLGQVAECQI